MSPEVDSDGPEASTSQLSTDVKEPETAREPTSEVDATTGAVDENDGAADDGRSESAGPTLSKNQQRKLARQARYKAEQPARRAREKAARKERKAEKRRMVEEDGADPAEIGLVKKKKRSINDQVPANINIVIDLGFDDKMTEKEIKSMHIQLSHVYNVNRYAARPANVIFTPLEGQLERRMESAGDAGHLRWKGIKTLKVPIQQLWSAPKDPMPEAAASQTVEAKAGSSGPDSSAPLETADFSQIDKDTVVYLTADSREELEELKEGTTYIIGGIVDHNRYKNLCLGIAKEHKIKHAALPIGKYIEMATRKVLTVNQCFEIMSKWLEYRDWEKAFFEVIPQRKFGKGETGQSQDGSTANDPALQDNDEEVGNVSRSENPLVDKVKDV